MAGKYYETHAHYDDKRFNSDREELLSRLLPEAGVGRIINIGADMKSSRAGVALAERFEYVRATVGVHPHDAKNVRDADLEELLILSSNPNVVAIGEIGLDFYYEHSEREIQRRRFRDQLELAKTAGLPVVIHSRDAERETYDIIKSSGIALNGGVIHCFSGCADTAIDYARLGFYIAFGGVITFPKAHTTIQAAAALPMEHILIETDCPYISPEPFRGKRNDSRNLSYICEKLAQIKGVSHNEAAAATWTNAVKLFGF